MPDLEITTKPGDKYASIRDWLAVLTSLPPDVVANALLDQRLPMGQLFGGPQMFPLFAANDPIDLVPFHRKVKGDIGGSVAGKVASDDSTHLRFGEFRIRLLTMPGHHVSDIVALCTDRQVAWVDARRGITGVADYRFRFDGDRAEVEFIRHTMSVQAEPSAMAD